MELILDKIKIENSNLCHRKVDMFRTARAQAVSKTRSLNGGFGTCQESNLSWRNGW